MSPRAMTRGLYAKAIVFIFPENWMKQSGLEGESHESALAAG
jgi:hypothetical protein